MSMIVDWIPVDDPGALRSRHARKVEERSRSGMISLRQVNKRKWPDLPVACISDWFALAECDTIQPIGLHFTESFRGIQLIDPDFKLANIDSIHEAIEQIDTNECPRKRRASRDGMPIGDT
jgi:hypothetical protein